jgi:hypothetical protein
MNVPTEELEQYINEILEEDKQEPNRNGDEG